MKKKELMPAFFAALLLSACQNTPDNLKSNKHSANIDSTEVYVASDHIYDSFDAAYETDYTKFKLPDKTAVSICDPEGVYEIELSYVNGNIDTDWMSSKIDEFQDALGFSIAGKIDTLAGNFLIGQIPTGSEDPYALRRAAYGVVRILLEKGLDVSLEELVQKSFSLYKAQESQTAQHALKDFLFQRLALLMQQRGRAAGLLEAVNPWYKMPLPNIELLLGVLEKERNSEAFTLAAGSAKRVCNILKKAQPTDGQVNEKLFRMDAEKELFAVVTMTENRIAALSAGCQSEQDCLWTLSAFGKFAKPLEKFFADVMVNVEDAAVRNNRLALLWRVRQLLTQGLVDISKI